MYSEKTNKELVEFLEQAHMLTFESQLNLNDEFNTRKLPVDKSGLESLISEKLERIKNLEYLKDFGFVAELQEDRVVITRTTRAKLLDIFAVVVGLLVFLAGVYGVASLVSIVVNGEDINVFTLAIDFAMASLLLTGFRFFSGLKRLLDFSGFQLSHTQGLVTLKKRMDLKLEEIQKAASDIALVTDGDVMSIMLGKHTIFKSNAENLIQRMTLEELANRLKS
jgi:hypothetical protein